jgi:hypothetical protein
MTKHRMRRPRMLLAGLSLTLFPPMLPGCGSPSVMELDHTQTSPGGDIVIEHHVDHSQESAREIWLVAKHRPTDRFLLYRHRRYAEVLFAPNEQWLIINDYMGADVAEPLLFQRGEGVRYTEVKQARISEKVWRFFAKEHRLAKPPEYHHSYAVADRWASDSKAVQVSIWGHSDSDNNLAAWLCVFAIDTLRPSLNLGLMNRGAFHSTGPKREKSAAALANAKS